MEDFLEGSEVVNEEADFSPGKHGLPMPKPELNTSPVPTPKPSEDFLEGSEVVEPEMYDKREKTDLSKNMAETLKHPEETVQDIATGFEFGNPLRVPIQKGVAAVGAAGQEVADIFRPEDEKKAFLDRYREGKEALFQKSKDEMAAAEERSPIASSFGRFGGATAGYGTLPFKSTKAVGPIGSALDRLLTGVGSAGAVEGVQSEDKAFDPERAKSAMGWQAAISGPLEAIPLVARGGRDLAMRMSKTSPLHADRYVKDAKAVMGGPDELTIKGQIDQASDVEKIKMSDAKEVAKVAAAQKKEAYKAKLQQMQKESVPLETVDKLQAGLEAQKAKAGEISDRGYDALSKVTKSKPVAGVAISDATPPGMFASEIKVETPEGGRLFYTREKNSPVATLQDVRASKEGAGEGTKLFQGAIYQLQNTGVEVLKTNRITHPAQIKIRSKYDTTFTADGLGKYQSESRVVTAEEAENLLRTNENAVIRAETRVPKLEPATYPRKSLTASLTKLGNSLKVGRRLVDGKKTPGTLVGKSSTQAYKRLQDLKTELSGLPEEITYGELRDVLKKVRSEIDYNYSSGEFNKEIDRALKGFTRNISEKLKGASPEYDAAMQEAKEIVDNLEEMSSRYGTRDKALTQLNKIINDKGKISEEALAKFSKLTGVDYINDITALRQLKDTVARARVKDLSSEITPVEFEKFMQAQSHLKKVGEDYAKVSKVSRHTSQGMIKNVGGPTPKIESELALQELGNRYGQNFVEDIKNLGAKQQFERNLQGGIGPRATAVGLGTGVGTGGIGAFLGLDPATNAMLSTALAIGGASIDSYLPKMNQAILDVERVLKFSKGKLDKYAPILTSARARGAATAGLVHQILLNDSEYGKIVESTPQP